MTVVPWPRVEAMSNLPPSVPTISSTTASPMPEPRTEFFALKNFCLTFSRSSGAMPRPWSRMDALTVTGVRLSVRKIVPPESDYLIALSNRCTNTCRSRAGSAQTGYGSGGSE